MASLGIHQRLRIQRLSGRRVVRATTLLALTLAAPFAGGQTPAEKPSEADSDEKLAEKLSNPIADLVSVPFQFNWQEGYGPNKDLQFVLNIQPVVPFHITKDWNLIGRFIVPYISQPEIAPGVGPVSGLGTITFSSFFSPAGSTGFTWGVGPVFGLPMTSDPVLGGGQWLIGPTAVALYQTGGGWTLGALVNQQFSIAETGNQSRPFFSQAFLQPFIAYTTKSAVTFTVNTESTYDWEATPGQRWTVPVNFLVSKLTRFGPFPFSIYLGAGYYAAHPDVGPTWKLRLAFTLLLPAQKT